jgi:hypothetical protein
MEDEAANLPYVQVVVSEEVFYGATEFGVDKFWNFSRKDDVEAALIDIPSHQMLCVGIKRGARSKDARAGIFNAGGFFRERCFFSGEDNGGSTVSEETTCNKIGHGIVILLPSERAKFDREEKSILFGECTDIVRSAGNACRSGNAAKAENRCALNIVGESH